MNIPALIVTIMILSIILINGCATVPQGPNYTMYPPGTPERYCAEIAYGQSPTGHGASEAASGAAIGAVAGAALGAIAGALMGDPGIGAAAGAGLGLGVGGGQGMNQSQEYEARRARMFESCMTARWWDRR